MGKDLCFQNGKADLSISYLIVKGMLLHCVFEKECLHRLHNYSYSLTDRHCRLEKSIYWVGRHVWLVFVFTLKFAACSHVWGYLIGLLLSRSTLLT